MSYYTVVYDVDMSTLVVRVNDLLKLGYLCLGGVAYDDTPGFPGYLQALVKK